MIPSFIPGYISSDIVQAVCWTLLHSLWQGLIAASLSGLIIISTRHAKPSLRYNLLSFVFIGFLASAIITFLNQPGIINSGNHNTPLSGTVTRVQITAEAGGYWDVPVQKKTFIQSIIYYGNKYSSLVTGIWAVFFFFNFLKTFTGLRYANRIRNLHTLKVSQEWNERLHTLTSLLGIHKRILLKESGIIKVPVVVGLLKPVILVPLGMFSHLSVEQVEAILVHELAHVRRKDFAVNLLQRIAESFFFFNPCIVWMSSLIREEREACCDDIVLEYTSDKKTYLEALISFRDTSLPARGHALALAGNHSLLNRVNRIITNENKKLNVMEKITLIMMVLTLTAFGFIPRESISIAESRRMKQLPSVVVVSNRVQPNTGAWINDKLNSSLPVTDTVPDRIITFKNISSNVNDDGKNKIISVKALGSDGKQYSYKLVNGEIKELLIDSIPVASDKYKDYESVLKIIEDSWQQALLADKEKQGKLLHHQLQLLKNDSLLRLNSLNNELAVKDQLLLKRDFNLQQEKDLNKQLEILKLQQADLHDEFRLDLDEKGNLDNEPDAKKILALRDAELADNQYQNLLIMEEKINRQNNIQKNKNLKLQKLQIDDMQKKNTLILQEKINSQNDLRLNENLKLNKAQIDNIQMKNQFILDQKIKYQLQLNDREQVLKGQQLKLQKISLQPNDEVGEIIDDLSEAGLVKDKTRLSFSLNDHELIVDGKKQDGGLHEKFRIKYIRNKKDFYKYKRDGHSTTTEIVRD